MTFTSSVGPRLKNAVVLREHLVRLLSGVIGADTRLEINGALSALDALCPPSGGEPDVFSGTIVGGENLSGGFCITIEFNGQLPMNLQTIGATAFVSDANFKQDLLSFDGKIGLEKPCSDELVPAPIESSLRAATDAELFRYLALDDAEKYHALVVKYWSIAYDEGRTNTSRGDDANAVYFSMVEMARKIYAEKQHTAEEKGLSATEYFGTHFISMVDKFWSEAHACGVAGIAENKNVFQELLDLNWSR